jgi:nicotinic acid phosphoribosyltransferase
MKTIGVYDHNTGEQITRDMTAEELAEYELGVNTHLEREAAELTLKEERLAILASLGLTEEQAKVLGLIAETVVSNKSADEA